MKIKLAMRRRLLHPLISLGSHAIVHHALDLLLLVCQSLDVALDLSEGVCHPVRLCIRVWAHGETTRM